MIINETSIEKDYNRIIITRNMPFQLPLSSCFKTEQFVL